MSKESVYHLSEQEVEGVRKLRQIFAGQIPDDLDNDLYLRRWIHGWKGQLNEIEPRLKAYLENRKAMKLDDPDLLENFNQHPIIEKYLKYFSFSQEVSVINTKSNNVLIVERIENIDLNKMCKVIPCGDFLQMNFIMCEAMLRQILKQERLSNKPSGLTILYDMSGIHLMDYSNPNAPINKIMKVSMHILQDYYCDILQKAYVINAPGFIHIFWNLMKLLMNKATIEKFTILGHDYKEVLRKEVDVNILPVHYGGNKRDTSGRVNPDTLCPDPAPMTVDDYYLLRQYDHILTEHMKPGAKFDVRNHVEKPGMILSWHFYANAEIQFVILRKDKDGDKLMTARFTVVTPKLPEEGELECDIPGEYVVEFVNHSTTWFSLKLDYAIDVRDPLETNDTR